MTKTEQAQVILKHLEEYIQVNHAMEEYYLKGIVKGLIELENIQNKA